MRPLQRLAYSVSLQESNVDCQPCHQNNFSKSYQTILDDFYGYLSRGVGGGDVWARQNGC